MKMKTLKYSLILPIFIGLGFASIQAQNFDFGEEKVNLFTDRTLFIIGEEIQFTAFLENKNNQSKTLYLELILPDGTSLVSQKHLLVEKQGQGKLEIPQDLSSGTYYLKAYTKYLRNFGTNSFTYLPLKIVNPYIQEFLSGEDQAVLDTLSTADIECKESKAINDNQYLINFTAEDLKGLKNASISIVPSHSFQKTAFKTKGSSVYTPNFFPETRGLSLSGLLVDSVDKQPLAFKEITLSIIDQKNFIPTLSASDGRFYFSLPEITGNHDIFISTKKEANVHPIILVDNDYDTRPISLPTPPFILSNIERSTLLNLAQSYQIKRNYFRKNTEHQLDTFYIPFYGKADNTLYLDKYISLETLEEYFTELPGLVHIKNVKKEKSFTISSPLRDMSFYSPLVLIDMVAVEDYNRILAVSPQGIEKVDIIPHPYVYGNFIYGGIISIRTRKGDFGGISLPKTGLFFNFDFFQAKSSYQMSNDSPLEPDTRNTLFWKTFSLAGKSSLEIKFKKRFSFENYWIIIQGLDKNGAAIRKIFELE
jgi:hypothetical protein